MVKDKLNTQINKFVGLSNSKHKKENSRKLKKINSKLKNEVDDFLNKTSNKNGRSHTQILTTGKYLIK